MAHVLIADDDFDLRELLKVWLEGHGSFDVVEEAGDGVQAVDAATRLRPELADLGAFESIGHSFEAVQNQAMFEMMSLSTVPHWVPLPIQRRFHRARAAADARA